MLYSLCESNGETESLYGDVDDKSRTGLWIILAYFIIGGKEKWAFPLCRRNYHYYGNLKRDNQTQGREKSAASIEEP
jgi:hypothetical protein